jgi:cytochrome c553
MTVNNKSSWILCLLLLAATHADADFPAWAYPLTPQMPAREPDDGASHKVPGSDTGMTATQAGDRFAPPDWHPGDHPVMPAVVANGRKPDVWACAFCHRPNGAGGPDSASLAGLPADYIVQQVKALASGDRSTALPERRPHQLKMPIARGVTEDDLRAAANYFASLPPQQLIRVEESATAPRLRQRQFFFAPTEDGAREPIGERIVEYPEDTDRFEKWRDARVGFIAVVPPGSVAGGEALVKTPLAGLGVNCAACHGADLRGAGSVPPLAGRSPTYLVRQLWDIQAGARHGAMTAQMKPVVVNMSSKDMLYIAAYLATLKP